MNPNTAFKDRKKPTLLKFNRETTVLITCTCGWQTEYVLTALNISMFRCIGCGASSLSWSIVNSGM